MRRTAALTQGNIPQQLIWLALPLICGNILQQFYNTVDAFIIGRFLGSDTFGAVGVAGTVMNLFIFILSGCCVGISVLFAQFYGQRDLEAFRREGFLALVFGLLLTAALALGALVLLGPLLSLIQTPEGLRPLVAEYLTVIFLGLPVTFLYNLASAALRAAGNTLAALFPLMAATLLNIGLDLLLVGACGMGISGAAIATVFSQGFAALLALGYLRWRQPQLLFGRADMRFDWSMLRRTASFGLVSALQQSAVYIGKLLVQGAVNSMGNEAINAYTAATRIEGFANSFGDSGAEAISVFVAQNTGAGDPKRVKRGFFTGMLLMIGLGLTMSLVMFVGAHASLVLMLGEGGLGALEDGIGYLRWVSVFYTLCFIGSSYVGLYRGIGWVSVPVIGSTLQITIRVILSYALAGSLELVGVAVATGIGWSAIVLYQTLLFRARVRLS